jgi:hypothetical protein
MEKLIRCGLGNLIGSYRLIGSSRLTISMFFRVGPRFGISVWYRSVFSRRGAKTWGFHESPTYPHMYCFLAWRERMESSTEKTLRWNTIVIGDFLNLGSVSHECRQYQFLHDDNVTKGWRNFFQ